MIQRIAIPLLIFSLVFSSYLLTAAPTIYTVDSPELSSAAYTLGIAHSPGYSFYLLLANLFSRIPVSEHLAYRLNLFSSLSLSLASLLLYVILEQILKRWLVAAVATLIFAWSYYVWVDGIVAEVYAFQLLCLNICLLVLWQAYQHPSWGRIIVAGLGYGLAVAAHPANIFFAPAMIYAFMRLEITWTKRVVAASMSLLVFLVFMLYFPIRYAAHPAINMLGEYNAAGEFVPANLQSIEGLWYLLSGAQFREAFPHSFAKLLEALWWFCGNFLGLGTVLGGFGLWDLWRQNRRIFWLWGLAFLPYSLFFGSYGAEDRYMMLLPAFWLWVFPFAYSLISWGQKPYQRLLLGLMPCLFFGINFPQVNISQNFERYNSSLADAERFPMNAYVFGYWGDIVTLEYLQIVEGDRPDVHYYNLFLFGGDEARIDAFVGSRLENGDTIIFLNRSAVILFDGSEFLIESYEDNHHQLRLR